MKRIFTVLLFCFLINASCNQSSSFVQLEHVEIDPNKFIAKIWYNKELIGIGEYSDSTLTIPHGKFVYFHKNRTISAKGNYVMGIKDGEWIRYDSLGNQLPSKIYNEKTVRKWQEQY